MAIEERIRWDGVTSRDVYPEDVLTRRDLLADAARDGDWPQVFEQLAQNPDWVNATRVGGSSWFTPLHQAAWHGAEAAAAVLVGCGAWRTLPTAAGERALDIALARGHKKVAGLLQPVVHHPVPSATLNALEGRLHALIRADSHGLADQYRLRLPTLAVLTELAEAQMYFPVPGMYGGFRYRLDGDSLVTESSSRVAGGSGRHHRITVRSTELVAEGVD
ncbi:ankyrin repeat domain-containing protein [Streptomyces sp. NPDC048352]|uniref:ankyrin repeat domain-containing protein n=1 Tax=Streptomyces sp. NPDC048352 TaxID=3154718 RepID=UPI00342F1AE0